MFKNNHLIIDFSRMFLWSHSSRHTLIYRAQDSSSSEKGSVFFFFFFSAGTHGKRQKNQGTMLECWESGDRAGWGLVGEDVSIYLWLQTLQQRVGGMGVLLFVTKFSHVCQSQRERRVCWSLTVSLSRHMH